MARAAWFHCFSGIAGDMALGALFDAGADESLVRKALATLPVDGWTLTVTPTQRGGIRAMRAEVVTEDTDEHRRAAEILELLRGCDLDARVTERALAVFGRLAAVEGKLHGVEPDDVEFHEVGSVDAIIDIVGVCAALESLDIDEVHASAVAQGRGMVTTAHGLLPVPAPATLSLLMGVPSYGLDIPFELTTPTGAAILSALARGFGTMPALTLAAIGHGAGARNLEARPNVTQVVIGELTETDTLGVGLPAMQLEVNVDDATGEMLAHTIAQLLEAGAHDAWITPVIMKKGRPAHTVHVLCDPARASALAQVLTSETGSLGVRSANVERWPQHRDDAVIEVEGQPIRVKLGVGRVKVEQDDAAAAAWALGLPLREIMSRAEAAGRALRTDPVPGPGWTGLDGAGGDDHPHGRRAGDAGDAPGSVDAPGSAEASGGADPTRKTARFRRARSR